MGQTLIVNNKTMQNIDEAYYETKTKENKLHDLVIDSIDWNGLAPNFHVVADKYPIKVQVLYVIRHFHSDTKYSDRIYREENFVFNNDTLVFLDERLVDIIVFRVNNKQTTKYNVVKFYSTANQTLPKAKLQQCFFQNDTLIVNNPSAYFFLEEGAMVIEKDYYRFSESKVKINFRVMNVANTFVSAFDKLSYYYPHFLKTEVFQDTNHLFVAGRIDNFMQLQKNYSKQTQLFSERMEKYALSLFTKVV